ncbi:MAG: DMT family transporter [Candidatus Peregrinibacteria bacterium]
MPLSKHRTGELLILLCAFLSSLFPIVTIISYRELPTFFASGTATLLSTIFFAILLTIRGEWKQLKQSGIWRDLLLISLFIGIYYILIFAALRITTAGDVSIMSLMEVLFTFLIMGVLLKHERMHLRHIVGGLCMVAGAGLILSPHTSGWSIGNLLVILATISAPFGNYFAQHLRQRVSVHVIMFIRSILIGTVLLGIGVCIEPLPTRSALLHSTIPLLINAIVLLGISKILWIEAIHRISISTAISLQGITPLFTLIFAYFLLHESILLSQLAGFVPIFAGVLLLTSRKEKS